jgi:2,3-bisphosphoglycerate-independent phosphoglycerate mutase
LNNFCTLWELKLFSQADWDIVKRGYEAHILGEAPNKFKDPVEAVKALRKKSGDPQKPVSDQFLEPFVIIGDDDEPIGKVEDGDAVVIFNFRADRVTELSKALEYDDFKAFERSVSSPYAWGSSGGDLVWAS